MVCLAAGQLPAAPATQPAGTQAAATHRALCFSLAAPAYPAGIANEEQYQQYLARELREANKRLESRQGMMPAKSSSCCGSRRFALTQASEPDLTRVWLWRQPQAEPELAVRALELARNALAAAAETREPYQAGARLARANADRIQMLNALLAMEGVLLAQA